MLRTSFRFGVLLLPLLFGIGVAAYAAAYRNDSGDDLRAFLHSDTCAAPCWQGIRPGVTRSFVAVEMLEALPWVTDLYTVQGIATSESYVRWGWTGTPPAVVDTARNGQMWLHDGRVYAIDIPLAVQFSTVWGAFGAPEAEVYQTAPFAPPQTIFHAYYFGRTLEIRGSVACPLNAGNRLAARVDAHIAAPDPSDAVSDRFPCATSKPPPTGTRTLIDGIT
jgi:hypothetical protein